MKVVLRDDVENLGHKGDLVDVADGYARNYLVPRGLAIQATKGVVKQGEAMRRNRDSRNRREREAAQVIASKLSGRTITVPARAGESGRLFGSVGTPEIVEAVLAQHGIELDRRKVTLAEPIKELTDPQAPIEVPVRLHEDVQCLLQVEVVSG